MKSFKEYISEGVKLTPAELSKPNSKTGEKRIDILRDLVLAGKPIPLADGGEIVVTNVNDVLADIKDFPKLKTPIQLIGKTGEAITTSHLAKSKVFGGGGGAGGGTAQTKVVESAQCVWLEAMLHLGLNAGIEEFTDEVLEAAYKKVEVDADIKDILAIDNDWIQSSYITAQHLIKNKFVHKNMTFHRGSRTMKAIYDKKNKALKNNDLPRFTDDKWNPGDIWAVDNSFKVSSLPVDSLAGLNKAILDAFVNRQLVGISLKKVKKKAKHVVLNAKLPPDTDDYKIREIRLESKRGTFWSSKVATVVFDAGKFEIRPNSYMGTNKAELSGRGARGGSASWNYIIEVFRAVARKKLPAHTVLKSMAKKIDRGDVKMIKKMYEMYNTFYSANGDTFEEFVNNIEQKDAGWIAGKLGGLLVAYHLKQLPGQTTNRAITKIINYAGSKSEDASTYVKVSN